MEIATFYLAGLEPKASAAAEEAARIAFPKAKIVSVADLAAACAQVADHAPAIVVASAGPGSDLPLDAQGRPACIVLSTTPASSGEIPAVSLTGAERQNIATIFRLAGQQLLARRDNARLRGDWRTLASRISHDLRSPLTPIYANAEMLRMNLPEPRAGEDLVSPIAHSADELSDLIARISFIGKATSSTDAFEPVDMKEVIYGVLQRVESRVHRRHAIVREPSNWPVVKGVPKWIETIWWHLIVNALTHAGDAPRIALAWDDTAGGYEFTITDSGPGVAKEKQSALFFPFENLHQAHHRPGLGLSLVRRLVDLQGGRCGYRLAPDGAPQFYFTLPAA